MKLWHILSHGKIQNPPKNVLSCLWKRQKFFPPEIRFSVNLGFHWITLSQWIQMAPNSSGVIEYHPFWVRTDFGYFKTWFGANILLFYYLFWRWEWPSPLWRPLVPPGAPLTPWRPPNLWYVIPGHSQSFWVMFEPLGASNYSVTLQCIFGGFPTNGPASVFLIILCINSVIWPKIKSCSPPQKNGDACFHILDLCSQMYDLLCTLTYITFWTNLQI